jgi:hypothetical protein
MDAPSFSPRTAASLHHHGCGSARPGFFWWEVDLTCYVLCGFPLLGLLRVPRRAPDPLRTEPLITDADREGPEPALGAPAASHEGRTPWAQSLEESRASSSASMLLARRSLVKASSTTLLIPVLSARTAAGIAPTSCSSCASASDSSCRANEIIGSSSFFSTDLGYHTMPCAPPASESTWDGYPSPGRGPWTARPPRCGAEAAAGTDEPGAEALVKAERLVNRRRDRPRRSHPAREARAPVGRRGARTDGGGRRPRRARRCQPCWEAGPPSARAHPGPTTGGSWPAGSPQSTTC